MGTFRTALIGLTALLLLMPFEVALGADAYYEEPSHRAQPGELIEEEHALDTHGEEHHEEGLPQLNFGTYPSQIFWLAVFFTVLYLLFSRKTLPEISNVLENRRQHIQSDLDTAEDLRRQAEEAHRAYEEALEKARAASSEYYMEAEANIRDITSERMNAFYAYAAEQVAETEKRVNHAKSEAMEDMSSVAAEIAAKVAEKILGVSTDLNQAKTVVKSIHNQKAA